jgi:hypothetical protein
MNNLLIQEIKDFQTKYKEGKSVLVNKFKEEFQKFFLEIFTKYPKLTAFQFTAYIPYWQDGEVCEYGVNRVNDFLIEGDTEFKSEYYYQGETQLMIKEVRDEINAIIFSIDESFYQDAFGDHAEITVYSDKLEVEEYEHE